MGNASIKGKSSNASFFREVLAAHERIAERAKGMLSGGDDRLPLMSILSSKARPKGTQGTSRRARTMRKY